MSEATPPCHEIPQVFKADSASASRLIHLVPDELAKKVPDHPLFSYPRTTNPQDGFVDVSSKRFANAINRTSWYLRNLLGPPKCFDTVGYMGPNDIRYFLFMFGAIKVGYKMLFTSPRNNLEGHLNVLKGSDCQIFLFAKGTNVSEILNERTMRTSTIPGLEELLDEDPVDVYPYSKTFEEARMDPCLVLHTTGSTGLPKPITWKVGILSTYEAWRTVPHVDAYVPTTVIYQQSKRAYTSMPLFHTSGLNAGITWALLLGVTLVYGAPHIVPNAFYVDQMHKYAGVDATMGAPSIYEELCLDPESLERLNNFYYVVASGAPLSEKTGKLLSKHTRVISNLGATETACLQRLSPSVDDYAYFYWHPTHSGIEMREVMDDLYELFIVREERLQLYQGIFNTFPDIHEWSMNDLYSRHPDPNKKFLYRYKGRKDDVIVLSNGEKIAPALMEATLMSDPRIKGAMVVGKGKFQPAALIDLTQEPPNGAKERHQLVEKLLPVIAEANEHAPAHAKLDQYHIIFAHPKKPIFYLGQGKIQRIRTTMLYEKEIEQVYEAAEDANEHIGFSRLPELDVSSKKNIVDWLAVLLTETADIRGINPDQDFFGAALLDSLQVIRMARELRFQVKRAGLGTSEAEEFQPKSIYSHSTLNQLAGFIMDRILVQPINAPADGHDNNIPSLNGHISSHVTGYFSGYINSHINGYINGHLSVNSPQAVKSISHSMQTLLQRYTRDLPPSTIVSPPLPTDTMTVVLTGSTGSLGSYLFEALYNNENVSHIICLNRSPNAAEKHSQMFSKRGLGHLNFSRVEFLQAELSKSQLGLDSSTYQRLSQTVTHIIHNQWPVNFNWSLTSFEPYIRGVSNLARFSSASNNKSFILFVSSVSAVGGWKGGEGVPEEPMYDFSLASDIGYGQSKLISECILDIAAKISGVRSACCRVGIIAGPIENKLGVWNSHEYIPSIIISSAYLGAFPITFHSRDRIDWLPVDKISHIIIEILVSSCKKTESANESGTLMYHVVNPNPTSWSTLAPAIIDSYPKSIALKAVSFEEWLEILNQSIEKYIDPQKNPASKLLDFYHGVARARKETRILRSSQAEKASKTLRDIEAVKDEWLRIWMTQWDIRKI